MNIRSQVLFQTFFISIFCSFVSCGGGGGGDPEGPVDAAQITGTAFLPSGVDNSKVFVENAPLQVIDFSRPADSNVVATGTTDSAGRFDITVPPASVVAVVVQGRVQVSGLIEADRNSSNPRAHAYSVVKDFDGTTDIACRAGAQILTTGVIDPEDFGFDEIDNLEDAARTLVESGQVNFKDQNSVAAAVQRIRELTDDGKRSA